MNQPVLVATIGNALYGVSRVEVPAESDDVVQAWELRKPDGTSYVVADTIHGSTCECASFVFRGGACKHIKSLRSLGLLERPDGTADSWPVWTDFRAVTARR